MRYLYAQIDGGSVCVALLDTHASIDLPFMIPIASMDETLLGKTWKGTAWVD